MNYPDIILAIPLLFAAIRGFWKGFIIEAATLFGLIAGVFLGILIADIIGLIIKGSLDINIIPVKIISFILIFIIVLFIIHLLARIAEKFIKTVHLNIFNRIGGIIAGILKTAFIISVLLIFINKLGFLSEDKREESLLYNPVSKLAPAILPDKDYLRIYD